MLTGAVGWRHVHRVWPPSWLLSRSTVVQEGVDPDHCGQYRRTPAGGEKRAVGEIPPQEIDNAVLDHIRVEGPSPNDVFGFHRTGREIRERYVNVFDVLERHGRIVRRDALLELAPA